MLRLTLRIIFAASFLLTILFMFYYTSLLNPALLVLTVFFFFLSCVSFLILMPPTARLSRARKEGFALAAAEKSDVWIFASKEAQYLPWYNAVSKEIGPCRLISVFPEDGRPRLIIFPQGSELSDAEISILSRHVETGASLLCECPSCALANLAGLGYLGAKYGCSKERLLNSEMDLTGATALFYGPSLRRIEGAPKPEFFFETKMGVGTIFVLTVEYARWSREITQGKPDLPKKRLFKKIILDMQGLQTPDLRSEGVPAFAFTPVLDVFDQALFGYIRDKLKLPAWWYYPQGKSCVFALTFDEDWFGNRISKFPDPEIPATWFLVDDSCIDKGSIEHLKARNNSFQFHWNRFILHLNKFGWHLCLRDIKQQINNISQKLSVRSVICRIHYLRWGPDPDNLFFIMREAGINLDSSFGPGRGQHGYQFATGYPYQVSDRFGRPIGIEEIPFQIHEPQGGATSSDHLRLLSEAKYNYHTAVVGLFHPYDCFPGKRSYEPYKKMLDFLQDKSIWCTNLEDLSGYWQARRIRGIASILKERELIIDIAGSRNGFMTLRLPEAGNIDRLFLDNVEITVKQNLILGAGAHTVKVEYSS